MLFYFTILKTTLSFIPYYFTIPSHPKLLFILKYYFFKLSLLFLSTVNFFSDFGVIPSFQRSHFFLTANFFPGLSKFQQPIFFNSIILRFPAVTFLSWPLYNFFPANHFFFCQIQRLFQTTYQIFFLKKEPVKYLSLAFIISFHRNFGDGHIEISEMKLQRWGESRWETENE